ncbi:hypothetical protein [Microseira sp. BLCC-F43]
MLLQKFSDVFLLVLENIAPEQWNLQLSPESWQMIGDRVNRCN